jgi:molybdopterin converting factor small subunit
MHPVTVAVTIPSLLKDCTGGQTRFTIEATTLAQALQVLVEVYPLLRIHLYNEAGQLRTHVQIFYNQDSTRWLEDLAVPLKAGDRLSVLQAMSGG